MYAVSTAQYSAEGQVRWHRKEPDVTVVRIRNIQHQLGMPPSSMQRDVLWVECRPPNQNSPGKWNNLMMQAVKPLAAVHPTRRVYLILAVGMKWMPFLWEPATPLQNPLVIRDHDEEGHWEVDHRMHKIPNASLPGQSHILPGHNGQLARHTALTTGPWARVASDAIRPTSTFS